MPPGLHMMSLHFLCLTMGAGNELLQQPGGMAVDTSHIPHNTPEGEVGKPEGLSGSQVAANSLLCILSLL